MERCQNQKKTNDMSAIENSVLKDVDDSKLVVAEQDKKIKKKQKNDRDPP